MPQPITKSVLKLVSNSLAKSLEDISEEGYLPRSEAVSNPPSPPLYLNPTSTPTHQNPQLDVYHPRDVQTGRPKLQMPASHSPMQTPVKPSSPTPSQLNLERSSSPPTHVIEGTTPLHQTGRRVSFHSESPETQYVNMIDWDFNAPLLPGPLPPMYLLDGPSPPDLKIAGRRKLVREDDNIWEQRDELLIIAENVLDRTEAPGFRALAPCADRLFRHELTILDSALTAHPAHTFDEGLIGYQFDLNKYNYLISTLTRIAR